MGLAKLKDYEWDMKDKKFKDWTKNPTWTRESERHITKPWWEE